MGRDRGAALVLEQAILPATAADAERTRVFAWYNVLQDAGHALGSLLAGLPVAAARRVRALERARRRCARACGVYAGAARSRLRASTLRLSPAVEVARTGAARAALSPAEPPHPVGSISALFALDSLGGGFLTTALLSYFFFERFGVGEARDRRCCSSARASLNALSHLGAAWLARRIGLVNTMVFTHIPSSLLLVTRRVRAELPDRRGAVPAARGAGRDGRADAPVLRDGGRAARGAHGRLGRHAAWCAWARWAVAPSFAGLFMQELSLAAPLFVGAGMKIAYDVLLYAAFRGACAPPRAAGARMEKPSRLTVPHRWRARSASARAVSLSSRLTAMRKTTGSMICPNCGKLISVTEERCPFCGAWRPGHVRLRAGDPEAVRRRPRLSAHLTTSRASSSTSWRWCSSPRRSSACRGLFAILSPGTRALYQLGMTGGVAWREGWWWTLLTAIYLHGGLLHIFFNLMWMRNLGPAVVRRVRPRARVRDLHASPARSGSWCRTSRPARRRSAPRAASSACSRH